MDPVPKKLGEIKNWNPNTLLISFKLETDPNLLKSKALVSIDSYGVDMVVANILATRRTQVTIYDKDSNEQTLTVENPTISDQISEKITAHIIGTLGINEEDFTMDSTPLPKVSIKS